MRQALQLVLFMGFICGYSMALASVCPRLGPPDLYEINEYDAIFIGEMLDLDYKELGGPKSSRWPRIPQFRVTKVYKDNEIQVGDTITVEWLTMGMVADLYPKPSYASTWLIYAKRPAWGDVLYRESCSRSRPLASKENPFSKGLVKALEIWFGPQSIELAILDSFMVRRDRQVDWEHGRMGAKGAYSKGVPVDDWTYYLNGYLRMKGSYDSLGHKSGTWSFFYPEDQHPYKEQVYVDGFPNGLSTEYYKNGNIKSRGLLYSAYQSNTGGRHSSPIKVGKWETFWENGNLKSVGTYVAGNNNLRVGAWWDFREDGTAASFTQYELCLNEGFLTDCELFQEDFEATRRDQKRALKMLNDLQLSRIIH